MQAMIIEQEKYAPINVAMIVYRCSPNKFAICRFVMIRTRPASDSNTRAGIKSQGKAEIIQEILSAI
jgi:hypothetical protein